MKTLLVLSFDWLGMETQEVVCVLSRHRDSLWPRQEKPHFHPQARMEKMCVCVCVCVFCLFKKGYNLLNSRHHRKKCCGFL